MCIPSLFPPVFLRGKQRTQKMNTRETHKMTGRSPRRRRKEERKKKEGSENERGEKDELQGRQVEHFTVA